MIMQRQVPQFLKTVGESSEQSIDRVSRRCGGGSEMFFEAFCGIFQTPSIWTSSPDFFGALEGQQLLVVEGSGVAGTLGV